MHGLERLREINEDPNAYYSSREPQHYGEPRTRDEIAADHESRTAFLAARQRRLDPHLAHLLLVEETEAEKAAVIKTIDDVLFTAILLDIIAASKPTEKPTPGIEVAKNIGPLPPFMRFWKRLNSERVAAGEADVDYKTAHEAFDGGATPVGAMTFIGKQWNGLRAVPSVPVTVLGGTRPNYHAEYRVVSENDGTQWFKVRDDAGNIRLYEIPEAAITAAERVRNETIKKEYH